MNQTLNVGDTAVFHTTSNDMMALNDHSCKIVGVSSMAGGQPVYTVEFSNIIFNAWQEELTPAKDKEMLS